MPVIDFRTPLLIMATLVFSGCAPIDLIGTFERSCDSSLPEGNWSHIGNPDISLQEERFDIVIGSDQPYKFYHGDEGSMAVCLAANGGFFPKVGALLISGSDRTIVQIDIR